MSLSRPTTLSERADRNDRALAPGRTGLPLCRPSGHEIGTAASAGRRPRAEARPGPIPACDVAGGPWEQSPQRYVVATAPFSPNRKRRTAAPWRLLCTTSSDVHDRDHVIAIVARRASRSAAGCACRWAIASVQPRRAAG
jgi:hypothetical protein